VRSNSKPILAVAAILIGVPLAITVILNVALRSEGLQRQLLAAVSPITGGAPLRIGAIYGLPLGGIRLTNLAVESPAGPVTATANSMTIVPGYAALLRGRLEVAELVIDHPVIRLQPATPASSLPADNPSAENGIPTSAPRSQGTTSSTASLPGSFGNPLQQPRGMEKTASMTALRRLSIRGGDLVIVGLDGRPALTLSGVTLDARSEEASWTGTIEARTTLLGNSFRIGNIRSKLKLPLTGGKLAATDLSASLGQGRLSGTAECELPPAAPSYRLSLNLDGASLDPLLRDAGFGSSRAEGRISGTLDLSGIAGKASSVNGKGSLRCLETVIKPADFLRQIGQLLQIDELQMLRLQEGKALFHVASGSLVIDDLMLRSQNLILNAQGPVVSSGELDLQARLLFNEKLSGRLRGLLGSKLTAAPEQGYSQLPFRVSGTPASPKTDLIQRLTGINIGGDLGGLIQGLFGRPAPKSQPLPAAPPAN
jgi:hypothetical protein